MPQPVIVKPPLSTIFPPMIAVLYVISEGEVVEIAGVVYGTVVNSLISAMIAEYQRLEIS
jgi:hypothetical protein